jgi:hypothetical protein
MADEEQIVVWGEGHHDEVRANQPQFYQYYKKAG